MRKVYFAVGFSVVTAFVSGALAGYGRALQKLGREFDERLERELAAMEKHYRKVAKQGEFATAEGALQAIRPELVDAAKALTQYQGYFDETKVDVPIAKTKNIFSGDTVDVDWELEKRNRTEEAPYVLTKQEYMDGELEYEQITLTYFEGDKTLVDERDDVIEPSDADELAGLNNLAKFGLQSEDPNVVYVRNHVREVDIEINRHEGTYAEVVAGFVPQK